MAKLGSKLTLAHSPEASTKRWWWLMFYGHFCTQGRLNRPRGEYKIDRTSTFSVWVFLWASTVIRLEYRRISSYVLWPRYSYSVLVINLLTLPRVKMFLTANRENLWQCRHHTKFRLWHSLAHVFLSKNSSYSLFRFLARSCFWLNEPEHAQTFSFLRDEAYWSPEGHIISFRATVK